VIEGRKIDPASKESVSSGERVNTQGDSGEGGTATEFGRTGTSETGSADSGSVDSVSSQTALDGQAGLSTEQGMQESRTFEIEKQRHLQELSVSKLSRSKTETLSDVEFQNALRKQETEKNAITQFTEKDYKNLKIQFPEVKDFKELAMIKFNADDDEKLKEVIKKPKRKLTETEKKQKEFEELAKIKAEIGMPTPVDKLSEELYDPWATELEKIVTKEEQKAIQAAKQALEARKAEARTVRQNSKSTKSNRTSSAPLFASEEIKN
jgi:hypothetical protein